MPQSVINPGDRTFVPLEHVAQWFNLHTPRKMDQLRNELSAGGVSMFSVCGMWQIDERQLQDFIAMRKKLAQKELEQEKEWEASLNAKS